MITDDINVKSSTNAGDSLTRRSLLASQALKIVFEHWIVLPDLNTVEPPVALYGNILPTMKEQLEDHLTALRGELLARKSKQQQSHHRRHEKINQKDATSIESWIATVDHITHSGRECHPNELKALFPIEDILKVMRGQRSSWEPFMSLLPTQGEGVYQRENLVRESKDVIDSSINDWSRWDNIGDTTTDDSSLCFSPSLVKQLLQDYHSQHFGYAMQMMQYTVMVYILKLQAVRCDLLRQLNDWLTLTLPQHYQEKSSSLIVYQLSSYHTMKEQFVKEIDLMILACSLLLPLLEKTMALDTLEQQLLFNIKFQYLKNPNAAITQKCVALHGFLVVVRENLRVLEKWHLLLYSHVFPVMDMVIALKPPSLRPVTHKRNALFLSGLDSSEFNFRRHVLSVTGSVCYKIFMLFMEFHPKKDDPMQAFFAPISKEEMQDNRKYFPPDRESKHDVMMDRELFSRKPGNTTMVPISRFSHKMQWKLRHTRCLWTVFDNLTMLLHAVSDDFRLEVLPLTTEYQSFTQRMRDVFFKNNRKNSPLCTQLASLLEMQHWMFGESYDVMEDSTSEGDRVKSIQDIFTKMTEVQQIMLSALQTINTDDQRAQWKRSKELSVKEEDRRTLVGAHIDGLQRHLVESLSCLSNVTMRLCKFIIVHCSNDNETGLPAPFHIAEKRLNDTYLIALSDVRSIQEKLKCLQVSTNTLPSSHSLPPVFEYYVNALAAEGKKLHEVETGYMGRLLHELTRALLKVEDDALKRIPNNFQRYKKNGMNFWEEDMETADMVLTSDLNKMDYSQAKREIERCTLVCHYGLQSKADRLHQQWLDIHHQHHEISDACEGFYELRCWKLKKAIIKLKLLSMFFITTERHDGITIETILPSQGLEMHWNREDFLPLQTVITNAIQFNLVKLEQVSDKHIKECKSEVNLQHLEVYVDALTKCFEFARLLLIEMSSWKEQVTTHVYDSSAPPPYADQSFYQSDEFDPLDKNLWLSECFGSIMEMCNQLNAINLDNIDGSEEFVRNYALDKLEMEHKLFQVLCEYRSTVLNKLVNGLETNYIARMRSAVK